MKKLEGQKAKELESEKSWRQKTNYIEKLYKT